MIPAATSASTAASSSGSVSWPPQRARNASQAPAKHFFFSHISCPNFSKNLSRHSLNAYVDVVRQEIIDRYQPGEDDPHLRVLRAAHLDEDEYFSQLVSEDLRRVIQDIRAAHKGDSESAPVNTVAEELRRDIEETMNFKGSDLERQAMLYCKRLGINYSKLTETEFRQLIHILDKSSLLKTHGSKRKMRK